MPARRRSPFTAAPRSRATAASADWDFVTEIAKTVSIPVFGSGDCIEPEDIVARMKSGVSGVYVGRGVLRNPWILAQARDLMEGRPARSITDEERGQFLLDYMQLLLAENARRTASAHRAAQAIAQPRRSRALGDQQDPRAVLLVYQGLRRRRAVSHRCELGEVDRGTAGSDRELLPACQCPLPEIIDRRPEDRPRPSAARRRRDRHQSRGQPRRRQGDGRCRRSRRRRSRQASDPHRRRRDERRGQEGGAGQRRRLDLRDHAALRAVGRRREAAAEVRRIEGHDLHQHAVLARGGGSAAAA